MLGVDSREVVLMANSRNPNSNSVLQALLDLKDCGGYGEMTLDHIITKISGDRKLQKDLQAKWDAHAYPEHSMVYAQLTITQALMNLSPQACKILLLLGSYASQTGLVQVSYPTLETVTDIKRTMVREAVQELKDHGLIRVRIKSARHSAPIYCVDPGVIAKGSRRQSRATEYRSALIGGGFPKNQYLLDNYSPSLVIKCDTVRAEDPNGESIRYNSLSLIPAAEAKKIPESTGTSTSGKRTRKRSSTKGKSNTAESDAQIPGQRELTDVLAEMEQAPGISDELPFG